MKCPPFVRQNKCLMKGGISMSGKKIYRTELKLEIVNRYLQGTEGLKTIAKEYHVGAGDIQKYRDAYLEHGVSGLCTTHGTYSGDFKVRIVEYMHNTGSSLASYYFFCKYKS